MKSKKLDIDLNFLVDLYINKKLSVKKISKLLGITYPRVYYRLKKANVPFRKGTEYINPFFGKKHSKKTKNKISLANKGKKRNSHTTEAKEKIGKAHRGKRLSNKTKRLISKNHANVSKMSNPMWNKKHSKKTREKIAKNIKNKLPRGKEHHWYKKPNERKTELYKLVRACSKYVQWRNKIYERDFYTCVFCKSNSKNKTNIFLNADHIKPFSKIFYDNNIKTLEQALKCEELWSLNNGRTLCIECHKKTSSFAKRFCK